MSLLWQSSWLSTDQSARRLPERELVDAMHATDTALPVEVSKLLLMCL